MPRPASANLSHLTAAPKRKAAEHDFAHVLSDAEAKVQELEAQRLLDKIREHSKLHTRQWGSPAKDPVSVRRSQSRATMSPTNKSTKAATLELRREAVVETGIPPNAMLAPRTKAGAVPLESLPLGAGLAATARPSTADALYATRNSGVRDLAVADLASPAIPRRTPHEKLATAAALASPHLRSDYTAAHIQRLETEVEQLRTTITGLLHRGADSAGSGEENEAEAGAASSSAAPGRKSMNPSLTEGSKRLMTRAKVDIDSVLKEKRAAERRVMRLDKEKKEMATAVRATVHSIEARVAGESSDTTAAGASEAPGAPLVGGGGQPVTSAEELGSATLLADSDTGGWAMAARAAYLAALSQGADFRARQAAEREAKAQAAASGSGDEVASAASRPRSASGRLQGTRAALGESPWNVKQGVTRPTEFSFLARQREEAESGTKKMSICNARVLEDVKRKDAEMEAALKYQFKAKDIPESTKAKGLLQAMLLAKEEMRKREHDARVASIRESMRPFSAVDKHEEEMKARAAASRAKLEMTLMKDMIEARKFKAHPIPATISNPDESYKKLLQRDQDRPARVAAGARALAASSSLPPRMALAEEEDKRKRAERAAKLAKEAREERAKSAFHANGMPDFAAMQSTFVSSMVEARKSTPLTAPAPFGFDSSDRKVAEALRKAEVQRQYELITSQAQLLRETVGGGSFFGGSTSGSGRGRPRSAPPGGSRAARPSSAPSDPGEITRRLAATSGPPAAMTRAVQMRMMETQRKIRERQEADRVAAAEEDARVRRLKEASQALGPLLVALEAKRRPTPLAWQMNRAGADELNTTILARQKFAAEVAERKAALDARIADAQADRVPLFLRDSLEAKKEASRQNALLKVAQGLASTASANQGEATSWEDVVREGGVDGATLFSAEDAELLGVA